MSWVDRIPTVQPMYGVPVVKYGPPPSPTPYDPGLTSPPFTGMPDWNSIWAPSFQGQAPFQFSLPDIGHWAPSFPRLMAAIALVAYSLLMVAALCGWTLRGGVWYLKNKK